jgi:hypothetical protein
VTREGHEASLSPARRLAMGQAQGQEQEQEQEQEPPHSHLTVQLCHCSETASCGARCSLASRIASWRRLSAAVQETTCWQLCKALEMDMIDLTQR